MEYQHILKTEYLDREFEEVLASETDVLLGVGDEAKEALKALGVHTVFDLAYSRILENAYQLCTRNQDNLHSRYGRIPSDVIQRGLETADLDELYQKPIELLDGVGPANGPLLRKQLSVCSIRDLGYWPPFQAIRQVLRQQVDEKMHFDDPDVPNELVPQFNEFPTEKLFYSVYFVDDAPDDITGLTELDQPLKLDEPEKGTSSVPVRKGFVARFEQSWTGIGLALGNLLHSMTLAPGESTRIAMVDWTRRQGVKTTEDTSQLEALSNSLMQTRSISEVTSAVAREAQGGFSKMNANSTVSNNAYSSYGLQNASETLVAMAGGGAVGAAAGAGAGGLAGAGIGGAGGLVAGGGIGALGAGALAIPGAALGFGLGTVAGTAIGAGSGAIMGGTVGAAGAGLATADFGARTDNSSSGLVDVVTTTGSSGYRDLGASMAQNILDRTQQHASSSRNKKASIVQEVREEEKEQLTTRVVTNYNHMHALTMNYFEVVQLYSVKVSAKELTSCLYVPFDKIVWTDELVERFRAILIRNALTAELAQYLARPANLSVLCNSTLNALDDEEKIKLLERADLKSLLDAFNSKLGVGTSATVLSPVFLPSTAQITDMQAADDEVELIFELTDGRRIPSRITAEEQAAVKTFISFKFSRKKPQRQAGTYTLGSPLSIFDVDWIDEPEQQYTLPVIDGAVRLYSPWLNTDIPVPVDLGSDRICIPPLVLYDAHVSDMVRSLPGGRLMVEFTKREESATQLRVFSVDQPVGEIKKIILSAPQSSEIFNKSWIEIGFTFLCSGRVYSLMLPFGLPHDSSPLAAHGATGGNTMLGGNPRLGGRSRQWQLAEFDHGANSQAILKHLNVNSDYYSQKVFQAMGELEYAELLARYRYEGKPLINQVDLRPLAISGKTLVFKTSRQDDLLPGKKGRHFEAKVETIPLGTGGVFGEAVLGRANSAEKLDITRFWNWQDSPIPLPAPEIAPLQAGSRTTNPNVMPDGLEPALVANQAPSALPAPQGLASILNALATSNLFRDMSGIAETAGLAQKSIEEAMKGATETGRLASSDLQKGLDFTKELSSKILQMSGDYATLLANTGFGALTGNSGSSGGSSKAQGKAGAANAAPKQQAGGGSASNLGNSSASAAGAAINYGKLMDQSQATRTNGAASTATPHVGAAAPTPSAGANGSATANERAAFRNMIGMSAPEPEAKPAELEDDAEAVSPVYDILSILSERNVGMPIPPDVLAPGDIILATRPGFASGASDEARGLPITQAMLYIGARKVVETVSQGVVERSLAEAFADDGSGQVCTAVVLRHPELSKDPSMAEPIVQYATEQVGTDDAGMKALHPVLPPVVTLDASVIDWVMDYSGLAAELSDAESQELRGELLIWIGPAVSSGGNELPKVFCSELVLSAFRENGADLVASTQSGGTSANRILVRPGYLIYVGHLRGG